MTDIVIKEIKSDQYTLYREFFGTGLIEAEEQFRITVGDEDRSGFPTKNLNDSFTLGVYVASELAGVVSFERDGMNREKLRHKGLLFRMYVSAPFRHLGLGKTLITEMLKKVNDIGDIEQINLTVASGNHIAKSLYEKFQFRTYGTEVNAIKWKNQYFSEELMVLHLK